MITKNVIADKYVHIMNVFYAKTGIKLPGFNNYTNRLKAELEKSKNSHIDKKNEFKEYLSSIDRLTDAVNKFVYDEE